MRSTTKGTTRGVVAAMTSSVSIENTLRTAFAELECVRVASRRVAGGRARRRGDARRERRETTDERDGRFERRVGMGLNA